MDFQDFIADENDGGRRVDKIVRKLLPHHSLGMIYKYFRKGLIRKNKGKTSPDTRVNPGDIINIAAFLLKNDFSASQQDVDSLPSKSPKVNVSFRKSQESRNGSNFQLEPDLFVNQHIRIINKPYDIPVQGGKKISVSLDKIVAQEYLQQQQEQGLSPSLSFQPGPLHRLDRKTTGVLVFSQSLLGAQWFSRAIQEHIIGKEYLALVEGKLTVPQHWQEEISRSSMPPIKGFIQSEISAKGKKADTRAIPLAWGKYQGKNITLLHLKIITGRTHQIRLHCSYHGHPLLGDTAYGGTHINKGQQDFFLHAWKITIPEDNLLSLPTSIEAPLPINFQNMIHVYLPETEL